MTCEHGYIGACAECDGSGQIPLDEVEAWAQREMNKPEARAFYLSQVPGEIDMSGPENG